MALEYPENKELVQIPSLDVSQASSPLSSLNAFSQNNPDINSIHGQHPFDSDLDGNAKPIPAISTEFHLLINGMYIKYSIYYNFWMNNCRCAMQQ